MEELRLLHSRSRISLTDVTGPAQIREELLPDRCAADGIRYTKSSDSGVWYGRLSSVMYQWHIEAGEDAYILHQETRVSSKFATMYVIQTLQWAIIWAALYYIQTLDQLRISQFTLFEMVGALLGLFLFILYLIYHAFRALALDRYPDPLVDLRDRGFEYRRYRSTKPLSMLWYISLAWLPVAGIINNPRLTLIIGLDYVLFGTLLIAVWYYDRGNLYLTVMERSLLGDFKISGISRRYASYTFQLSGVLILIPTLSALFRMVIERSTIFGESSSTQQILGLTPVSIPLVDELFALFLGLSAVATFRSASDEDKLIEYHDFQNRKSVKSHRIVDAGVIIFSSCLIYGALFKTLDVLLNLRLTQLPESVISFPLTLSLAAILTLYFPIGIAYQHYQRSMRLTDMLEHSVPQNIAIDGYEANVRVLDTDSLYATSFSTRRDSYIVVSRGLVQTLRARPLAAIVAHEEGHIANGDTRLCNMISLISTLLLVGQNVLYDMVNFYARERRADDYARDKLGDDALYQALDTLSNIEEPEEDEVTPESFGANFSPRFDPKEGGKFSAPFELFFGGFALSDAHPSIADRKQRLDPGTAPETVTQTG